MRATTLMFLVAIVAASMAASPVHAQTSSTHLIYPEAIAGHVIVPQSRVFSSEERRRQVEITQVKVGVVILEQAATTTMDIELRNQSSTRQEAELLVPVPEGAVVRGFSFSGSAKEPSAELLPKDKATAMYRSIVAKIKDPALMEFAGYNMIRSSVFPLDPHGAQKIRLTYEHLLPADGQRIDYMLPRTESIDYKVPWEVSMKIKSQRAISTLYSPSHKIDVQRETDKVVSVKISQEALNEPGPLRLSYLQESGAEVTATLMAYPSPEIGGGYFLMLAGLPAKAVRSGENGGSQVKREMIVVLDRSGSMQGQKIEQAKAAALQAIEGLFNGERFNIIDYNESISSFAGSPVEKDNKTMEAARQYIRRIQAGGSTNLHDALLESLRTEPREGSVPIVLFLTDGLPTAGVRNETAIRADVEKANAHHRRIFTFGVGYDVNAPLLSHLASNSLAVSTFVLPDEEIEGKMSQVVQRLSGPVVTEPKLEVVDAEGKPATGRITEIMPGKLLDLYEGDQLVLLGKYYGEQPLRFRLRGNVQGKSKQFAFEFNLDKATTRNSFVPRLWASRKIAVLVDQIRQDGAAPSGAALVSAARSSSDPKMKEAIDEIVRLSVQHGILTEYTAFLAKEGTNLNRRDQILQEANANIQSRAILTRNGVGAVNQSVNNNFQQSQVYENRRNAFYDQNMNRVQTTRVQQINDRAFFQQGNRWIDGAALNDLNTSVSPREIEVGSTEFYELLEKLTAQNRQGTLSMSGEILVRVEGQNVLIKTK
jgi:Ca-activated chloride channel homolog